MTEPGNTLESQPTSSSGSEEMDNTVTTDAAANAEGNQPTGESTAVPESAAPETGVAPETQKETSAAPQEASAEPAPAATVAEPASGDATSAQPQDATSTAEPQATVESDAGSDESRQGESADGSEDGSSGRRRSGRQLPKMPEEQMREIWNELVAKKNAGEEIELEVISTNRGGVVASYNGVEVFIPISHWSLDRHNTEGVAGVGAGDGVQAHVLEITSFDTDARRVTATRRTLLRKDLLTSLEVGQRLHGRVASILDFGAFVDLGGVDGLVHASEISYDRTRRPSELLNKGDEVEVVIREIDREKKRIYLGMKELQPSPWEGVEEKYPVGTLQRGRVVGIGKNGAFIELEPGLEGFVRVSELSWTKRVNNPKEILKKGMDIEVKVLDSSARKQRLSLSYRQAQDDPWQGLATKFAVGTDWSGEIREISNKGVVVAVEEVEGFLPRGRMGREAKRLPEMKVGEKLNVHVIEIEPDAHSLIFGLPMPEGEGGGFSERGERNERGGGERGGGDRGGERRGGGGRDRDRGDHRGDRGDRGDRGRSMGSVTPVNEMKSADTVSSFALGDMIGDAIKKALNYSEAKKEEPKPKAKPAEAKAEPKAEQSQAESGPEEQGGARAAEASEDLSGTEAAKTESAEQTLGTDDATAPATADAAAPDAGISAEPAAPESGASAEQTFSTSFEGGAEDDRGNADVERPV